MKEKKIKGVVFDFNGTLFWDTHLHNEAWNIFLQKHGLHYSNEEFFKLIHGKNNHDLLKVIFDNKLTEQEIEACSVEKEEIYYQLCRDTNTQEYAPGVIPFLTFLRDNNIPYTIATASGIENIEFYQEHLNIQEWFDLDNIVYNDGTIKGKPDPEIFQIAIEKINCQPKDVLVFEDSTAGLQGARRAGAGKIVAVNSNNDDYSEWNNCQIITNFDQIDRTIFAI